MRVRAPEWFRLAAVWVVGLLLLAAPARAEDPPPFQEPASCTPSRVGCTFNGWLARCSSRPWC